MIDWLRSWCAFWFVWIYQWGIDYGKKESEGI